MRRTVSLIPLLRAAPPLPSSSPREWRAGAESEARERAREEGGGEENEHDREERALNPGEGPRRGGMRPAPATDVRVGAVSLHRAGSVSPAIASRGVA